MKEHYAMFDFDEDRFLVRYESDDETIGDQIEDAIDAFEENDDSFEDWVTEIMDSMNVKWEFVPVRRYWI